MTRAVLCLCFLSLLPALARGQTIEELDTLHPNQAYIDAVHKRAARPSLGYAVGRLGEGFIFGVRYDQPITKAFYLRFAQQTNFGPFVGAFDPVIALGIDTMMRSKLIFGLFRLYGGGGFWAGYRPKPSCQNPLDQGDLNRAAASAIGEQVRSGDDDVVTIDRAAVASAVEDTRRDIEERCDEQKDAFTITGGGYSGIEFFSGPIRGFFIEIGGGGGAQKNGSWSDSGLILRAGSQFYF